MAKFRFGKGKKEDSREDELRGVEEEQDGFYSELGENYDEDLLDDELDSYQSGFDDEDGEFFDDDFGIVHNPNDEDDLEAQAEQFSKEVNIQPEYKKATPKWYEKGVNIIISIVIVTGLVVTGLFVFREPIRGFIGSRTEEIRDVDIQGEVKDYTEGVKETLQGSEEEVEEVEGEEEVAQIEEVESMPEGEYTVGENISQGLWVAENVLLDVYATKQDYEDKRNPISTNVNNVDTRLFFGLTNGQFVIIQAGELEYNNTRPEVAINIGDTTILEKGTQYFVGKDIPEGFYTLYNSRVLDVAEGRDIRESQVRLLNATDEEPSSIGVERKTTVFLREGLIISVNNEIIVERVSSDGTFGGDSELLNDMTDETNTEETETEESEE